MNPENTVRTGSIIDMEQLMTRGQVRGALGRWRCGMSREDSHGDCATKGTGVEFNDSRPLFFSKRFWPT
jgi:hypothetical protein